VQGNTFWKCFNSKFGSSPRQCRQVDGIVDSQPITGKFCSHVADTCSNSSLSGSASLAEQYNAMRSSYVGSPLIDEYEIDAELVEQLISDMKHDTAAGLDNSTAEPSLHSHSLLLCVLATLFNWFHALVALPISLVSATLYRY
jgi:hypothetical protein